MNPTRQLRDAGQSLWLDNITRDLITREQYDLLTGPWRSTIGPIHPDDTFINAMLNRGA